MKKFVYTLVAILLLPITIVIAGSVRTLPRADPSNLSASYRTILVGNSSGVAQAITLTDDVTVSASLQLNLAESSVGELELTDGSVSAADMATNSVGTAEIQAGGVASEEISDATVNAVDLATNSVTSIKISNGSIVGDDIAAATITPVKMVNQAIETASNCALTTDGTSFISLTAAGGGGLTSTNVCKVGVSSGSGLTFSADYTQNVLLNFSYMTGNTFGISSSATWGQNMPFILSTITNGVNNYLAVSRIPLMSSGTPATTLCQIGDSDCDDALDTLVLTNGLTLSDWTLKPMTTLGWVVGQYDPSVTTWNLALGTGGGINKNFAKQSFKIPPSQPASALAGYFLAVSAGGTNAPSWAQPVNHNYTISENGEVTQYFNTALSGNCTVGGASTVYLPLLFDPIIQSANSCGYYSASGLAAPSSGGAICIYDGTTQKLQISDRTGGTILGNQFRNTNDDLNLTFRYRPF